MQNRRRGSDGCDLTIVGRSSRIGEYYKANDLVFYVIFPTANQISGSSGASIRIMHLVLISLHKGVKYINPFICVEGKE